MEINAIICEKFDVYSILAILAIGSSAFVNISPVLQYLLLILHILIAYDMLHSEVMSF